MWTEGKQVSRTFCKTFSAVLRSVFKSKLRRKVSSRWNCDKVAEHWLHNHVDRMRSVLWFPASSCMGLCPEPKTVQSLHRWFELVTKEIAYYIYIWQRLKDKFQIQTGEKFWSTSYVTQRVLDTFFPASLSYQPLAPSCTTACATSAVFAVQAQLAASDPFSDSSLIGSRPVYLQKTVLALDSSFGFLYPDCMASGELSSIRVSERNMLSANVHQSEEKTVQAQLRFLSVHLLGFIYIISCIPYMHILTG